MRTPLAIAAVVLSAGAACADIYPDPTGDIGVPNPNLDFVSVTLTNDLVNLYATVQVNDDIAATNWGKYLFMFDTNGAISGRNDNPWLRAIDTGGRLNEIFVGSWVDGAGAAQVWTDTGAAWSQAAQLNVDLTQATQGRVSYTIPLALLGLSANGQTIFFDVMSTGGNNGDPGIDHLSRSDLATPGWGTTSLAGNYLAYTLVPAPGSAILLAMGAAAMRRRRR